MVAVTCIENAANRVVDRQDAGRTVIEARGNLAMVIPVVSRSHFHAMILVRCADEFAPADDLPQKAFE